jgi:hypothetical protein
LRQESAAGALVTPGRNAGCFQRLGHLWCRLVFQGTGEGCTKYRQRHALEDHVWPEQSDCVTSTGDEQQVAFAGWIRQAHDSRPIVAQQMIQAAVGSRNSFHLQTQASRRRLQPVI